MPTADEVLRWASCRRPCWPRALATGSGRGRLQPRQDKLVIERERVAGDHVRPARLAGCVAIQHVAGGPQHVGIDLPQAGVPAQPRDPGDPLLLQRVGWIVQPRPHGLNVAPRSSARSVPPPRWFQTRSTNPASSDPGAQRSARCRRRARRRCRAASTPTGHPPNAPAGRTPRRSRARLRPGARRSHRRDRSPGQAQRPDHRHGQHHVRRERFHHRRQLGRWPRPVEDEVVG